ncbi:trypsin-like serine protease [Thalassotalea sp. ND16A]|uniref:trypsin-like serine protease n=1 Tax=Thalassotalea sp. ND16A TaxID=1535422 RepID=UPI00051A4088|nr:trypsin-like serine protease [Thalassotalea sp. ND16A]KGK00347.1 hypothetical protein ND16A_3554 [Thalassotalea sp. ND16A]
MKHLILLAILFSLPSYAIVIRHDVSDSKYQAELTDFPALATFYIDGAHGTLIKSKWIVTAAHATFCIKPNAKVLINNKARVIKNLYIHPDYTPGQSHDIALVELVEEVLDVAPADTYQQSDESGKQIWFIGIGGTGTGITGETIDNAANNGVLRKAQNTIIAAPGPLIKFIFNRDDEALPLEGVSGGGDSGGPAFIASEDGFKLLGVSSRPEGKFTNIGEYGITEVYSRVSFFSSWIEQVIAGNELTRKHLSVQTLKHLPAGLTEDILPAVCKDIGISSEVMEKQ